MSFYGFVMFDRINKIKLKMKMYKMKRYNWIHGLLVFSRLVELSINVA